MSYMYIPRNKRGARTGGWLHVAFLDFERVHSRGYADGAPKQATRRFSPFRREQPDSGIGRRCDEASSSAYIHTHAACVGVRFPASKLNLFSNLLSGSTRPGSRASPAQPRPAGAAMSEPVRQKLRPAELGFDRAFGAPSSCPELRSGEEEVRREAPAAGGRERGCRWR